MARNKLIVVAGPTAVGKTSLAIKLATDLRTSVVSADSRQIYREMTIGTAKPTVAELAGVPHYFIDTHSVEEDYDAAQYATDALAVIADLFKEHTKVILCGGSGLYIRGVCEGFDDIPDVPDAIRDELMDNYRLYGLEWLQERMCELDPVALETIDRKNPHRLIRALEVRMHSGRSILEFRKNSKRKHDFDVVKIGLELPRAELYRRIDERVDHMIAQDLIGEAKTLSPMRHRNALQTVGYQEIFDFFDGRLEFDECVSLIKRNSRRYAKRQLTWFKRDPEFTWFHPDDVNRIIDHIRIH